MPAKLVSLPQPSSDEKGSFLPKQRLLCRLRWHGYGPWQDFEKRVYGYEIIEYQRCVCRYCGASKLRRTSA